MTAASFSLPEASAGTVKIKLLGNDREDGRELDVVVVIQEGVEVAVEWPFDCRAPDSAEIALLEAMEMLAMMSHFLRLVDQPWAPSGTSAEG